MGGKTGGHGANIHVDVDLEIEGEGRSTRHKPDGTTEPGPTSQRFVRINNKNDLKVGDWVINPGTNETHKILGVGDAHFVLSTKTGPRDALFVRVFNHLLKVVDE